MPAPKTASLPGRETRKRTRQRKCSGCRSDSACALGARTDPPVEAERHAATMRMLATIRGRLPFGDRLTLFRVAALVGVTANPALINRDPGELASWASQLAEALAEEPSDERPGG